MQSKVDAKNAIMQAAIDEFAEVGLGNGRTSSIAKRAGVSSGLIHYHFETKEKLYMSVLRAFSDTSLIDDLTIIPLQRKCSPLEKLQLILYSMSEWLLIQKTQNIIRFIDRAMIEAKSHFTEIIKEYPFSVERYLISIVNDGISKGIFQIKYPSYFVLEVMQVLTKQISFYYSLESESQKEFFFPPPYPGSLQEYYIDTSIRKIIAPDYAEKIQPVSGDLKMIMDTYIEECRKKEIFASWAIMIHIIARIFNESIE